MKRKELIFERINRVIEEDYGINNELEVFVDRIGDRIVGKYLNNGMDVGSIVSEFRGKKVTYRWRICRFKDMDDYFKAASTGVLDSEYRYGENVIYVSAVYVGGKFLKADFYDSLWHESEHLLQTDSWGRDFVDTPPYRYSTGEANSDDELTRHLSTVFYMNDKTGEIDATVNGLWGRLRAVGTYDTTERVFIESDAYGWLNRLYSAIMYLETNKDNAEVANAYNKLKMERGIRASFASVVRIARKSARSMERKIGRVITRFKNRGIVNEGIRFGRPSPKPYSRVLLRMDKI